MTEDQFNLTFTYNATTNFFKKLKSVELKLFECNVCFIFIEKSSDCNVACVLALSTYKWGKSARRLTVRVIDTSCE